ncbi:MAG: hypothetical protein DRP42_07255 [Tenericutes bacterium]|nr:MAG: hypothetical protein DRP42_07255 [Mycoplasmatota bacterium]
MSFALTILAESVTTFGKVPVDELTQGMVSIGAILAGFAIFSRLVKPKGMLAASLGLVVISGAMLIMVEVLRQFAAFSWEELQVGLVGMAGALLILVVAANAMNGALVGAAAMLVMSIAIIAISVALKLLSTLSWAELGKAIVGLAAVFVVLGLAGLILAPLIPILLLLGISMLLIGLAAGAFGLGLLAAATGLVAIGASAAVIAAGIGTVGTAIVALLPKLGTALAEALVNFLQTIADNTPLIVEAMNAIILGMIESVVGLIPNIVIVIMDMVTALLTAINDRLPELIQQGYDILLAFIKGIEDNIADIIAAGLRIVAEIINGIEEGLPDLVDSAFSLLLTFLTAIDDAIVEYMPQIIEKGIKIGASIIEGMIQGLWGGLDAIKAAISELVQEAIDRFRAKWGMASPSKVAHKLMGYVMQGFVNGVKDNTRLVRDAFAEFSEKAQNGIDPLADTINRLLEGSPEFSPVITPVLDLGEVDAGLGRLSSSFRNSAVLANVRHDQRQTYTSDDFNDSVEGEKTDGMTFNQYNYSPKALDRAAIYRQTKTYVAKLAV